MVIKSCPLLVKDTETWVGSSLASYFVLFSLISLVSFYFVDFVSFHFVFVDFVSFRFVFVDFFFVSFRFYFVSHFIGTRYKIDYLRHYSIQKIFEFEKRDTWNHSQFLFNNLNKDIINHSNHLYRIFILTLLTVSR